MSALGKNCDVTCSAEGLRCIKFGGFPGGSAVDIFSRLGVTCARTFDYKWLDNPAYSPNTKTCYGARKIPKEIDCHWGKTPTIRRLCPCH